MIPNLIRGCTYVTVACLIATGCSRSSVDLSPANWPEGEWDRFTEIEEVPGTPRPDGRLTVRGASPRRVRCVFSELAV